MNVLEIIQNGTTVIDPDTPNLIGHYYNDRYYIRNKDKINLSRISESAFEVIFGKLKLEGE